MAVSRRELFGSLCAMVFLVNLARVVFAPLVQPVAADLGVPAASLGVVTSAAWLGSAAPRLPTGYVLTRIDRHRVVGATGTLLVATSVLTALSNSRLHLAVGAFLMGCSSGMYFIAANPLVSELFPERLGRAIGLHGMASQVAAVGAPLSVSAILLVGNWRTTFLCIAAVAAVATVVTVVAARRTDLPAAGRGDRSIRQAARAQWPIILTGIAFLGAAGFLWNATFNLYGDYLEVAKGIDPATGRTLLSLMFAAGVPAFVVTGRLADRVPNVPLLLSIVAATVVGVLALTVLEGLVAIAVVSIALGYAVHGLFPAADAYLLSSLPDRHRASAYSVYSASMMFVQAFGSGTVGTAVAAGVSYTAAFRAVAGAVGLVLLVLLGLYAAGRLPVGGDVTRRAA
jgi:predicted MFS family arabinose efflux permease